jgi:hypothetical protein
MKACWANVLCCSPILVASATNVSCADLSRRCNNTLYVDRLLQPRMRRIVTSDHCLAAVISAHAIGWKNNRDAHILSLLRAANPSEHKTISTILEDVNHLRTVRFHNLLPESRSDDYKRRQASIWLFQNGGEPPDWPRCCRSLCAEVITAVRILAEKWRRLTANSDDAAAAVQDLIATIDREWPPHLFDRIIEYAASEIGLQGLDCVKYRQHRLDRWRELVGFFESREHAEAAMKIAIHRELELLFGNIESRSYFTKVQGAPTQASAPKLA